jgi:hypothetical protein
MRKLLPVIITLLTILINSELIVQSNATTVTLNPNTVYVGSSTLNILSITGYKTASSGTLLVMITVVLNSEYKILDVITITSGTLQQSVAVYSFSDYH